MGSFTANCGIACNYGYRHIGMGRRPTYTAGIIVYCNCHCCSCCGNSWETILTGALDSIKSAIEALVIIMCVGMLIASWIWSGTMPAMVYYGLDLIAPSVFLFVGALLCGIVGLATGSSWTASGTVGVALMGVAMGLGIDAPIAAGMVISGAYMGDKLSPMSDSTNVAAAAGQDTAL